MGPKWNWFFLLRADAHTGEQKGTLVRAMCEKYGSFEMMKEFETEIYYIIIISISLASQPASRISRFISHSLVFIIIIEPDMETHSFFMNRI